MAQEKNILIVDDDIELGNLLAKAVSDMSETYNVRVARNVDEAMVQVQKSQTNKVVFDLVITDIKMSGLSGLELLEALNSIVPGTKTIAMTAYNSSDIADRAQELSVEAYLTKPFIISEFRQIVRETLDPQLAPPARDQEQPALSLSSEQRVAIGRLLASLRTMTGATASFLMHSGGQVVAMDVTEPETSMEGLCATLESARKAMTDQLSRTFGEACQVKQSYFGTSAHSICAYHLNQAYTVVVAFGPAVKEGQVWYYLRDAGEALQRALTGEAPTTQRRRRGGRAKGDVFEMLDQFFPESTRRKRKTLEADPAQETPAAAPVQETQGDEVPPQEAIAADPQPADVPARPLSETELASLDAIDWDSSPGLDWDAVAQDTDQGFTGLSFDQAQGHGLLAPELATPAQSEGSAATIDRPPVDEIDWNIETEMDWDAVVQDTDKGLGGMSFEEAQKRGLLGGIEQDS